MAWVSLKILFYILGASSAFNNHFLEGSSATCLANVEQVCHAHLDPSAVPLCTEGEVDEADDDGHAFRLAIVKEESSPIKEYYLFIIRTSNLGPCSPITQPNRLLNLRI